MQPITNQVYVFKKNKELREEQRGTLGMVRMKSLKLWVRKLSGQQAAAPGSSQFCKRTAQMARRPEHAPPSPNTVLTKGWGNPEAQRLGDFPAHI